MLRFAVHYGFRPVACRPYRPQTKGRVERAVSYLRQNFFYARSFRDLDDLNQQCATWLKQTANTRLHATTSEVPIVRLERDHSHLLPLPTGSYIPLVTLGRRVSRDGFVSYNGNGYSVPDGLARAEVELRATLTELRLFQDGRLLVSHPLQEGRGQRRTAPDHQRDHALSSGMTATAVEQTSAPLAALIEVQRRSLEVYEQVLR